ncbi:MAG TPA: tetratricopeptide repeat protein [Gammaproteobacteria bacterium]|jgi:tetratricopeptide (TPR) repeat protein|nr:tetratricopeptide repeat protein [Gammaproteobacteria bacterium]
MRLLIPLLLLASIASAPLARADDTPASAGENDLSDCHDSSDADDNQSVIEQCSSALTAGGLDNEETFMAYLYRGMAHHSRNENDAAVADFTEAMASDPDHKDTDFALFERGAAYSDEGQYAKALADFDATVKLKPDEATYRLMRGNTYFNLERNVEALADLSKAIELDPKDAGAFSERSVVYFMQGEYAASLADSTQLLQLKADDDAAHTEIGEAHYFLGQYPEALAAFDAQLAHSPKDDYAMTWRYLAAQRAGQDGSKPLAAALEGIDDHKRWTYVLGQLYLGKANREQVLIAAAAAAGTDMDLQKQVLCQVKSFLGEFYRNSGQAAAAPLFKDAMQLCASNSIGRIVAQRGLASVKKAKKN